MWYFVSLLKAIQAFHKADSESAGDTNWSSKSIAPSDIGSIRKDLRPNRRETWDWHCRNASWYCLSVCWANCLLRPKVIFFECIDSYIQSHHIAYSSLGEWWVNFCQCICDKINRKSLTKAYTKLSMDWLPIDVVQCAICTWCFRLCL